MNDTRHLRVRRQDAGSEGEAVSNPIDNYVTDLFALGQAQHLGTETRVEIRKGGKPFAWLTIQGKGLPYWVDATAQVEEKA